MTNRLLVSAKKKNCRLSRSFSKSSLEAKLTSRWKKLTSRWNFQHVTLFPHTYFSNSFAKFSGICQIADPKDWNVVKIGVVSIGGRPQSLFGFNLSHRPPARLVEPIGGFTMPLNSPSPKPHTATVLSSSYPSQYHHLWMSTMITMTMTMIMLHIIIIMNIIVLFIFLQRWVV